MAFDPFKKGVANNMTLDERVARDKGSYAPLNTGWGIPFIIFYSKTSLTGILLANEVRHIMGLPCTFLVYWEGRFQGVINWTKDGWIMDYQNDPDLGFELGEFIQIYYG